MCLAQISSISANRLLLSSALGFCSLLLRMSGSQFQGQNLVCPENDIILKVLTYEAQINTIRSNRISRP